MYSVVLLLAMVVAVSAVDMPLCPSSLCGCPAANGQNGDLKLMTDPQTSAACMCNCGREEGAACMTDDQCTSGFSCAAPRDFSKVDDKSMGVCTNKCQLTKCPQYQTCSVLNNNAVCMCRTYDCDSKMQQGLAAYNGNVKQIFNSKCEIVNTNCKLMKVNSASTLWTVGM